MQCMDFPAWIQALSAVLIVFVTGYYTYYAGQQVKEMKNAIKITERAWMGIVSITGIPVIGQKLTVDITFKNVGKSPAHNVTIFTKGEDVIKGKIPNFDSLKGTAPTSKGIAFPGAEIHSYTTRNDPVGPKIIEEMNTGIGNFFIYGISTVRLRVE
ncbi:MAG: hypothetical protein ACYC7J_09940 [Syntrophales bacterium]